MQVTDFFTLIKGFRTVIYARVSTDDEEQLNSFEAQQEYYETYCKENELNFVNIYSDRGRTGTNVGRPDFMKMLEEAGIDTEKQEKGKYYNFNLTNRKPKFDLIIVKDVARFARNTADTINLVTLLREKNVYVLFETQNICSISTESDMMIQIYGMLAESESKANSRRQKFAYEYMKKNKIYKGHSLPYGYEKNENNEIVINEDKAKIVRYIFERLKTVGTRQIAKELNEKGYKTEKGIDWSNSQVLQISQKKAYYGNPEINKYSKEQLNSTSKLKDKEEFVELEGKLPKIISKEDFEEAQKGKEKRTSNSGYGQRIPKTEDVFYHKIYCGCCGGMYTRKRTLQPRKNGEAKSYYSYYCLNKNKKSNCTNSRTMSDKILKNLICSQKIEFTFPSYGATDSILLITINEAKKRINNIVDGLKAEYQANEDEMKHITKKIIKTESENTIKLLEKEIDELSEINEQLNKRINKLTFDNLDYLAKETLKQKKLIEELANNEFTEEQKLSLVNDICISEDDVVSFSFKLPNYNQIIKELNEIVDEDLKIEGTTAESFINKHTFVVEKGGNFIKADDYFRQDEDEYLEAQYQMSEISRQTSMIK